ncbi:hypothetical protein Ciccas_012441, partial [Cichlidogyrus casuarinus]
KLHAFLFPEVLVLARRGSSSSLQSLVDDRRSFGSDRRPLFNSFSGRSPSVDEEPQLLQSPHLEVAEEPDKDQTMPFIDVQCKDPPMARSEITTSDTVSLLTRIKFVYTHKC